MGYNFDMGLPKGLLKFFWDIDASSANPARHEKYYISRILEKGDKKAVTWLFGKFGKKTVKKSILSLKLSPRSANYWKKFFRLT